jgi:hypothetical protein
MRSLLVSLSLAVGVLGAAACTGDESLPIDAPQDTGIFDVPMIDGPAIDAPTDASALCSACTSSQICVQNFNGTCGDGHVECQPRVITCVGTGCSPDCDFWHCRGGADAGSPYTCGMASCPGMAPNALHCFGP